jgi:hypothetical protein
MYYFQTGASKWSKVMQKNNEFLELDIWRGFAIIFMIANHAGIVFLGNYDIRNTFEIAIVFIGSFAPVLFFMITGFGYGISSGIDRSNWSVWYKAGILILMDILLRGGSVYAFGWDFLGFIALSMIIVNAISGASRPIVVCLTLMAALFGIRFILGPLFDRFGPINQDSGVLSSLLGLSSFAGISYWLTPWLFYPLLGFIAGRYYKRYRENLMRVKALASLCLLAGGLVFLFSAWILKLNDMIFFRWGTMSVSYFVLSFAILLLSALIAWLVSVQWPLYRWSRYVAQRGVSCLVIVPIHYSVIYYTEQLLTGPMSTIIFMLYLVAITCSSYLLAHYFLKLSKLSASAGRSSLIFVGIVFGVFVMILSLNLVNMDEPLRHIYVFGAEMLLCLLLPLKIDWRGKDALERSCKAGL